MRTTRYSSTRIVGASCTACTKLTPEEHDRLHWLALERGMSDYQLTREILQAAIAPGAQSGSPSATSV